MILIKFDMISVFKITMDNGDAWDEFAQRKGESMSDPSRTNKTL